MVPSSPLYLNTPLFLLFLLILALGTCCNDSDDDVDLEESDSSDDERSNLLHAMAMAVFLSPLSAMIDSGCIFFDIVESQHHAVVPWWFFVMMKDHGE